MLQGNLHAIVAELLKNKDAKEPFFRLVGAACALNTLRAGQYFCHAEMARMPHVARVRVRVRVSVRVRVG